MLTSAGDSELASNAFPGCFSRIRHYRFSDTSPSSAMRRACLIEDDVWLTTDGGNLPAMLLHFKNAHPLVYHRIVQAVRQIFPSFSDFILQPQDSQRLLLRWQENNREYVFGPHQLSDGTLRAMALMCLLLQPDHAFPDVLLIDEPELGLHPSAVETLANLLKRASDFCQVIIATQSMELVDHFAPSEVLTAERKNGETLFRRHDDNQLAHWLERYSLGELWQKNVIGGGPF